MSHRNHVTKLNEMQSEISSVIERGWQESLCYEDMLAAKYKSLNDLYEQIEKIADMASNPSVYPPLRDAISQLKDDVWKQRQDAHEEYLTF